MSSLKTPAAISLAHTTFSFSKFTFIFFFPFGWETNRKENEFHLFMFGVVSRADIGDSVTTFQILF